MGIVISKEDLLKHEDLIEFWGIRIFIEVFVGVVAVQDGSGYKKLKDYDVISLVRMVSDKINDVERYIETLEKRKNETNTLMANMATELRRLRKSLMGDYKYTYKEVCHIEGMINNLKTENNKLEVEIDRINKEMEEQNQRIEGFKDLLQEMDTRFNKKMEIQFPIKNKNEQPKKVVKI